MTVQLFRGEKYNVKTCYQFQEKEQNGKTTANMGLAKAGVHWELQPFVLLINFGAVRQ